MRRCGLPPAASSSSWLCRGGRRRRRRRWSIAILAGGGRGEGVGSAWRIVAPLSMLPGPSTRAYSSSSASPAAEHGPASAAGDAPRAEASAVGGGGDAVDRQRSRRASTKAKAASTKTAIKAAAAKEEMLARRAIAADLRQRTTALQVGRSGSSKVQIASEELCDDILERLGPSLHRHVGCDLIDLHPGIGLWSEKLHSVLRPRSHILLEPRIPLFQEYLEPLLQRPGVVVGPYRASIKNRLQIDQVLSPQFLPHQTVLAPGDPRLKEPNDTLLVVGNFAWQPRQPSGRYASVAQFMLHHLLMAVRTHSSFHKYGLVRMLMWVHDADMHSLLPATSSARRKLAVLTEVMSASVTAVCAADVDSMPKYAKMPLDQLSVARSVAAKMEEQGIMTPPRRETTAMQAIKSIDKGTLTPEKFTFDLMTKKFADLEDSYYSGGFEPSTKKGQLAQNPKYTTLMNMRSRRRIRLSVIMQAARAFVDQQAMDKEWMACQGLPEEQRLKREADLTKRRQSFYDWLEQLPTMFKTDVLRWLDDNKGLRLDPPLLQRDRRPYEPLKVHADEFIPPSMPSLLDIQPRAIDPMLEKDLQCWEIYHALAASSRLGNSKPLRDALRPYPGAYEWCTPRCPSLTDPARGGCIDLDDLRIRALTQEMLLELTMAWRNWPLRPDRLQFLTGQGEQPADEHD